MRFGQKLQKECVPEWKKAYFEYKAGKKLLKRIKAEVIRLANGKLSFFIFKFVCV
jgi:SPX domain protein involved in polyphosphate accumulation